MTRTARSRTALTAEHAKLRFDTTRWQRLLFEGRRASSSKLSDAIKGLERAIIDAHPSYDADVHGGIYGYARDTADAFACEVFARVYGEPEQLDSVGCPAFIAAAHEALGAGLDSLRVRGAGDPDLAALGAAQLLDAIAGQVKGLVDEARREAGDPRAPKAQPGAPSAAERARAAARGAGEVGAAEQGEVVIALAAFGQGLDVPPPSHDQADDSRMRLADLLAKNARVADVLRRAGRMVRIADSKRRERTDDARSEVVSIERGAELSRVLPSQLTGLRHPLMRKLVLRSIVEQSCLQYELAGKEPVGRGPMVVLVDRSYSMLGEPHEVASAAAIAAVVRCTKEHRSCTVVGFTGAIESVLRVDEKGNGHRADFDRYAATIDSWNAIGTAADVVLAIASSRPDGGTDFARPLTLACRGIEGQERADVLLITDGQASATPELLATIQEAREERGLRVFACTVNGGTVSPAVRSISDEVVDLDAATDADNALAGLL